LNHKNLPSDANEIIERIATRLGQKFRFGYHTLDDMKQQAALFAWEGINDSWDPERPLENFLWIHVRNRLYNFKRNNYGRPEKPCDSCPLYVNKECTKFDEMLDCNLYKGWMDRNAAKRNLMSSYSTIYEKEEESSALDDLFTRDIINLLDEELHVQFREDWIRFTNNLKLPKARRERILEEIVIVLKENGIDPSEQ
jgi:hypothetical protein